MNITPKSDTGHRPNTIDGATADLQILIVDDDESARSLHATVLGLAGYATQSASDGEEALLMLATHRFDLVLTDCKMPRLDGIGLVRALRGAGSRIPIMMVSGSIANGGTIPGDVRDEVAATLPKPVKILELLAGVANALHAKSSTPGRIRITEVIAPGSVAPRKSRIADFFPESFVTISSVKIRIPKNS